MCHLSSRISRRYENMENYALGSRKAIKPRKGSIYVHDKLLVHGADIKWVWGKPCWNHPAFKVKPMLQSVPDTPHCFVLPSHPA